MKRTGITCASSRFGLAAAAALIAGLAWLPASAVPSPAKPLQKVPSAPAAEKEISAAEVPATRAAESLEEPEPRPDGKTAATKPLRRTAKAATVYTLDLGKGPGKEWSHTNTDVTPKDNRKFLGQFGNGDEVTLSLSKLPAHKYVRLSFDLYLIKTWDGSSEMWGASTWAVSVLKGPVLLYASFANCGFFTDNNEQSFPDSFPATIHPAWTGSAEHQTLGYIVSWGGPDRTFGCDSVYKFKLAFPHEADSITLQFQAFKHEAIKSESWGLANVKVETLDAPPNAGLSKAEMENLWKTLIEVENPIKAFHAVWTFAGAGPEAVKFLRSKLGLPEEMAAPAAPKAIDPKLAKLIKDLDSDIWRDREDASEALEKMGLPILEELQKAIKNATSEEAKFRLTSLIDKFTKKAENAPASDPSPPEEQAPTKLDPEALRISRALDALEVLGTKGAMDALEKMNREPRDVEKFKIDPKLTTKH